MVTSERPGRPRPWLSTAIGTACLVLAFPPVSAWPLAVVGPAALALGALQSSSGKAAFWRTSLAGLVFFLLGIGWLAETSPVNLILTALAEAPLVGLFGWMAFRVLRTRSPFPALPLLWVAHETIRFKWPLNGFTWLGLGHAAAASPIVVQCADLGGVLLVSFVVASASAGLLALALQRKGARPAGLVVAAAIVYGLVRPATLEPGVPGPLLAAVQPGFPQRLKDDPARSEDRWRACFELTQQIAGLPGPAPDMLVFPETLWPWTLRVDGRGKVPGVPPPAPEDAARLEKLLAGDEAVFADARAQLRQLFASRPPALLLGAAVYLLPSMHVDDARMHNSAFVFDADDRLLGRYDKVELVPGGEFLPLETWMPESWQVVYRDTVRDFAGFVPSVVPGPGPQVFDLGGEPYGVTICYENVYGDYTRKIVGEGARFLVNLSNEAWFGESVEFDHMELQSILRSVETRRAIFRATNSGVSCLQLPDGRPPEGTLRLAPGGDDRGVRGVFVARVPLHEGLTPYVVLGDWPGLVGLVSALVLLLRSRARPRVP